MVVGTPPCPLSLGSLQAIINQGGASLFLAAWFLAFSTLNLFRIVGKCILCFAFALPLCFYSSSLNLGIHQTKASFIRMHDNEMNEWIK
jgi:hypothetical protein